MDKPYLLHFATPGARVSPFDVNMAYDAGWDAVIPYAGVGGDDIAGFTQDAIFSRGPRGVRRTGLFIGGRDAFLAADMLDAARRAMVPPFEVSVFADPSGAYTTAAAMLAKVERALDTAFGLPLRGRDVLVLGGSGPVGVVAATLAAQAGARVRIASHQGAAHAQPACDALRQRYGLDAEPVDWRHAEARLRLIADAEVVLAVARAGVQVLGRGELAQARRLRVAADLNAVPPAGIETIGVADDARPLDAVPNGERPALGIGALAVGNVKYQVQQTLLRRMREADAPLYLGFAQCLDEARRQLEEAAR